MLHIKNQVCKNAEAGPGELKRRGNSQLLCTDKGPQPILPTLPGNHSCILCCIH